MRKFIGKIKSCKNRKTYRRKLSIRATVSGTAERPRLCAVKTNRHLQVQVVDDSCGKTIFSCQTFGKNTSPEVGKNKDGAKVLGTEVAKLLKDRGISRAVFDRNGKKYTGSLEALANSIREGGILF